ncbi:MAG: SDR family NAD(P)-dependent oxidoreductase [Proteobacteria bacterium]|nr:SDR family NAD(P)-dependent oxidoreductase [Pseudomonadota bacterium]
MDIVIPGDQVFLVTDDGTGTTPALARVLQERGWNKIVVLRFSQIVVPEEKDLPHGIERVSFAEPSESCLEQTLAAIREKHGNICGFIHLHPQMRAEDNLFPETDKTIFKQVFFIAKHLKPSLNQASRDGRACFVAVTRLNGKLGIGEPSNFSAIAGGLYGLVKTVNVEWGPVFCRAIDLSPDIAIHQAVDNIAAELTDPDRRLTEVGYGDRGRSTLAAEVEWYGLQALETPARIDSSSVFLISGGAKGVTAACVVKLAARYQCGFILLGRSEFTATEPDWAQDCCDDSELKKRCMNEFIAQGEKPTPVKIMKRLKPILAAREIEQTLRAISQTGGRVEYLSADINDAENLKKLLPPAVERLGPITGIVHGAGVLADKLIVDKTEEDFEAVYTTKISGLNSLLNCVAAESLDYLVLFSSAAGFYGNEAQSDYACANEILNKFAHLFKQRYPKSHVVAFNWGPWDGGMVTPELKKLFEQRNIDVIPIDVGAGIMVDELSTVNRNISQIVVGSSMVIPGELEAELKTHQIRRQLTLQENPFLTDHVIGGEPVLPIICALSWMAAGCEQLYPGYYLSRCEAVQVLKGIVFNDTLAEEYILDIRETAKSASVGIDFDVRIFSNNKKGKPVHHYSSKIKLLKEVPAAPTLTDFDSSASEALDSSTFYQDGTLFHGPLFQNLKRMLNISPERLTLECEIPCIGWREQGQFAAQTVNPFADDSQLQALLVWARRFFQSGSLPLKVQQAEFFSKIPFGERFLVSLEVKSSGKNKMVGDVTAHDSQGKIYSRLSRVEVFISKTLNDKFIR